MGQRRERKTVHAHHKGGVVENPNKSVLDSSLPTSDLHALLMRDSYSTPTGKGQGKTDPKGCNRAEELAQCLTDVRAGSSRRETNSGFPVSSVGILPLAKSTFDVLGSEWELPGHGEQYADCGTWRFRGCLHTENHQQEGLLEDHSGKAYIEMYKRSCLRAVCPVCYEKWAGKEAQKIEYRLAAVGRSMGKVIHITVSPTEKDVLNLPYPQLRARLYSIVRKNGFLGGSCIFHPFREDDRGFWYFSPHFHLIGYGWIHGTKEGFESHGWIVKNIGVRDTVSGTALYQLSHCGIHKHIHAVTWFGKLSYNKLKVPIKLPEKRNCPMCGEELVDLHYVGRDEDLPDLQENAGFWMDADQFILRNRYGNG